MAEWSKAINCKFIDIFIFIGSNPISLFFVNMVKLVNTLILEIRKLNFLVVQVHLFTFFVR